MLEMLKFWTRWIQNFTSIVDLELFAYEVFLCAYMHHWKIYSDPQPHVFENYSFV